MVWDPIADEHEEVRLPTVASYRGLFNDLNWSATIMCDANDCDHLCCRGAPFWVVFVGVTDDGVASAFLYASKTRAWTPVTASAEDADVARHGFEKEPAAMVGNSVYFTTGARVLLRYEFGGEADRLSFVPLPPFVEEEARGTALMPAPGGRLRFAGIFAGKRMRIWESEVRGSEAAEWVQVEAAMPHPIPLAGARLIGATHIPRTAFFLGTRTVRVLGESSVLIPSQARSRSWIMLGTELLSTSSPSTAFTTEVRPYLRFGVARHYRFNSFKIVCHSD